jgi:tRNA pseudouridine55 synthase
MSPLPKYVVLEKAVGQTPLQAVESYRAEHPLLDNVPMAYAGRLDPMASGQLLVLIGEECKQQEKYHALDKEYEFEVLLGSRSDTGDILGLIDWKEATAIDATQLRHVASTLKGPLSLPYPKFSSRTVKGKPLHLWTLEGRLDEIEIPSADTTIYQVKLVDLRQVAVEEVYTDALRRIESIPLVTEASKALGRDFRRSEVRVAWQVWLEHHRGQKVQIVRFKCVASSGTYMRSLSAEIARRLDTDGLAFSIHRSRIGVYKPLPLGLGIWTQRFH